MNNYSLETADRTTHLKIVVVSLIAAIAVVSIGIAAHPRVDNALTAQANGPVVKAGKAVVYTRADGPVIR